MRTRIAAAGAVLIIAATTVVVFQAPSRASTSALSTSMGTLQLKISDTSFEVSGCVEVPIEAVVTAFDSRTSWNIDLDARRTGAAPSSSAYLYGSGSARELDDFFICPFEGAGEWLVTGTLSMTNYYTDTEASAQVEASFTLSKASSTTSLATIKRGKTSITVTGKVTSLSTKYGEVGAQGNVLIESKAPRSSKWVRVGSAYSSSVGAYSATIYRRIPTGSDFRAVFEGSDSVQSSTSATRRS